MSDATRERLAFVGFVIVMAELFAYFFIALP